VTYSIVARDKDSGQLGVAVQSCYFSVGSVVTWARAGVGAVATQSFVDPGYGPRVLDLLFEGRDAVHALEQMVAGDELRDVRQVGVVSAAGQVASHTGSRCIDHVGHAEGEGYTAQANMMAGPGVCEAMASAFESSAGPLAHRLVDSLVAAESEGGDARGQMSAAILIVEPERREHPWEGEVVNVRVDHHPEPLAELARLVRVAEAYRLCDAAEEALVRGDTEGALAGTEAGLALLPGEGNLLMSHIVSLVAAGRMDDAAREVRQLVAERASWEGILRALMERELFGPLPEGATLDTLLGRP
jgi:uncharacterized Ntn-hydrolase superfamily protein